MTILGKVLSSPVTGPIRGIVWLARTIQEQVNKELYDEDKVRGELTELEMRLDSREIELAEYEAQEESLLQRLNEIREMKKNGEI